MTRVHQQTVGGLEITTIVSDSPWSQNAYVVAERSTGAFVVVDPGFDSPELRDAVRTAGTRPTHILATHGHFDHVGAAADLTDFLDTPCRIGRNDARIARQSTLYAAAFDSPRVRTPRRVEYIDGDSTMELGSMAITALALPGHTPGSLGFEIGDVLVSGDTLFHQHVGRTDLPGSDAGSLAASIDRLLESHSDTMSLLAGHGRPWDIGAARDWWTTHGRQSPAMAAR